MADESAAQQSHEPADARFADDDEAPSEPHEQSITDELRRRITEVSAPERKGRKPIWIGVGVVVVLALAGLIFATGLASLFPDLDTSR